VRRDLREVLADRRSPWMVIAMLLVAAATQLPTQPAHKDPSVYLDALQRMRRGVDYYPAMDAALRAADIGPVATARGFRTPWLFEFWEQLPGDRGIWLAYLLGVMIMTIAARRLVDNRWALLAPTVVLLAIGFGGSMIVEPWTAPWIMASLAFTVSGRDRAGATCALVAVIVRELALPLVIAGLLFALVRNRSRWPWIAALGLSAVTFWLHARSAAPYLEGPGREAPLWMSSTWGSFPRLVGFGIPLGEVLGPLALVAAAVHAHRRGHLALIGPLLSFGLIGLVAERPYWGAIIVPVSTLLAADLALARTSVGRIERGGGSGPQPGASPKNAVNVS
jgi:hypothetical protein